MYLVRAITEETPVLQQPLHGERGACHVAAPVTEARSKALPRILFTRHHLNGYISCVEQQGDTAFVAGCVVPNGAVDSQVVPVRCGSLAIALETADRLAHSSCSRGCGKWTIDDR
jgi:hypothetical protein